MKSTNNTSVKLPPAVPFIVANETAERFSYYGMNTILMVYLTSAAYLAMPKAEAAGWIHLFKGAVYFFPLFGALLADILFGKYRVMFWLSLVYCVGHLALAIPDIFVAMGFPQPDLRLCLFWGLALIALGSGGIKSCTSAILGDQFSAKDQHLMTHVYHWFYLGINTGAFFSTLLTPWLLKHYGPGWAFGVPGIFMALATLILWLGRKKYRPVKPAGKAFFAEFRNRDSLMALGKVSLVFLFLILFWAVYEQTSTLWVKQAQGMNNQIFASCSFLPDSIQNFKILPSQVQAVNPLLILTLIPVFTRWLYPWWHRTWGHGTLPKIAVGLFLTAIAQIFPFCFEIAAQKGIVLNIAWQILGYLILTTAEVFVSVTSLEFAYTQSPKSMKSVVMGIYLMTITAGNFFVAGINFLCEKNSEFLAGNSYYLFFLILALANAILFLVVSRFYEEKTILQD